MTLSIPPIMFLLVTEEDRVNMSSKIRYRQQEVPKLVFLLSEKDSVTWVAVVLGIANPPDHNPQSKVFLSVTGAI